MVCVSFVSVLKLTFQLQQGAFFSREKKKKPPLHYTHCPNPYNEVLPCNYILFLKPSIFAHRELTV